MMSRTRSSRFLRVLAIVLIALVGIYNFSSWRKSWYRTRWNEGAVMEHPIPKLMRDAEVKFKNLMSRQSKTLRDACKEYRTRYKRDPPKGFDDWWQFTQENNVKIIDEYDSLFRDLEPFWNLSGEELRRRAVQIGQLPSIDLVRITNGKAAVVKRKDQFIDAEVGARARAFEGMLEKFQQKLPDMDFPINAKAEGRILVPWEHTKYPNTTKQDSSGGIEDVLGGPFVAEWKGDGSVWDEFRRTCDPSSAARRILASRRSSANNTPKNRLAKAGGSVKLDSDFSFSETVDDNFDFCAHPWARPHHGHFFSDWRTISALYPVFSPGKAEGYSDIIIPSHYYYFPSKGYTYGYDPANPLVSKDFDDGEVPWQNKTNKIFWRGSTTGGGSSPPGFVSQYQRHRFIAMVSDASDAKRTVAFRYPHNSSEYVLSSVPVTELNKDIMDAGFTKAIGCVLYPGGCEGMKKALRFTDAVPLGQHWQHKYLIDIDGMGYSARWFAFLKSSSAVMKTTVYKEFFSDWIQPWLHYIPLSSDYSEIYNIHAYFSGASPSMVTSLSQSNATTASPIQVIHPTHIAHEGDAQLHKIAEAGREWKMTVGRIQDMDAFIYRLCLEWARLWSDDRESMSYNG
ncbi:capsule-associated protein CAP1 [Tulasnella sp. 418]|nr:capsule-associated protein CAP1 [Tulasnella sp. 418]